MRIGTELSDAKRRKALVRNIIENESLQDVDSDDRGRQWTAFSSADQKKINEGKIFVGFGYASGLAIEPFDYENEDPPLPDIHSRISRRPYYFELGEITGEGLARGVGISQKTGDFAGCCFSQVDPLSRMLQQKCTKPYSTGSAPMDLLLYFSRQYPHEEFLLEYLERNEARIRVRIKNSPFS